MVKSGDPVSIEASEVYGGQYDLMSYRIECRAAL
jgi:hypothetical protein